MLNKISYILQEGMRVRVALQDSCFGGQCGMIKRYFQHGCREYEVLLDGRKDCLVFRLDELKSIE